MVKISNNVKMKKRINLKIEKSLNGSSYKDWIMRIKRTMQIPFDQAVIKLIDIPQFTWGYLYNEQPFL